MKKLLLIALGFTLLFSAQAMAADFAKDVLPWLNSAGLTKYSTQEDFRGSDDITRGEASKFVDQYAQAMKLKKTYTECNFTDIGSYDSTLTPHIAEACAYGLLKGSKGMFNPTGKLTEAQGMTLVMRSLHGFQDETGELWYLNYYVLAKNAGMVTTESLIKVDSTNITREKLGMWFYMAAHMNADMDETNDETMDETTTIQEPVQITKTDIVYSSKFITIEGKDGVYSPNEIKVTQGERILIEFKDTDVSYGTELAISLNAKMSESGMFIIDTSTPGTYTFSCTTNCENNNMIGTIVIEAVDQSDVQTTTLANGTKRISVTGDKGVYTPMVIVVNQNEEVKLEIIDGDKAYGLVFAELSSSIDVDGNISPDTSKPGVYKFQCETNCQAVVMEGKLIVQGSAS